MTLAFPCIFETRRPDARPLNGIEQHLGLDAAKH